MNSQSGFPRTEIAACFHNRNRERLNGFRRVIAPFSMLAIRDRDGLTRNMSGPWTINGKTSGDRPRSRYRPTPDAGRNGGCLAPV